MRSSLLFLLSMLAMNLVFLFLGSSLISLFGNRASSLFPACPGWYSSGLKSFFPFVPNFASPHVWEKTFPEKVCKPLTPKGLLQEVLAPGICLLADEPKGLMAVPPPVCPISSRPPTPSPPPPLPPVVYYVSLFSRLCLSGCLPLSFSLKLSLQQRRFHPKNCK
ncbi:hypothetical protein EDC94DRAFT_645184 [Helicostylum pulchrum]|nr:hypothetical protein EDC94DRAFT_645184 [Helicostylum pulchrum]